MPFIRALRLGLTLPLLCAALCSVACGDEDEDQPEATEGGDPAMGEREGPAGCYIGAAFMCDCDVVEADCTAAIGGMWVPQGCARCE